MVKNDDTFLKLKLKDIKPTGFIKESLLTPAIGKLEEIKLIVDQMVIIRNRTSNIPPYIDKKINEYLRAIVNLISSIEENLSGSSTDIAKAKDRVIININNYYEQCFNGEKQDYNKFLDVLAILNSLGSNNESLLGNKLSEIESEAGNILDEVKKAKNNINKKIGEAETIIVELKKKASEVTVSDYASVFEQEANKSNTLSKNWLIAGASLSVIFIISFILINMSNIFPTEIFKQIKLEAQEETFVHVGYDITNIIIKLILLAIQVFLISFSFKQYNVYKHLSTINRHRQNALNSYQLFANSIIGDDFSSRNTLMVQVAKSIYENTQSTGFLGDKSQNMNSGVLELTKIIGDNKPI